MGVLAVHLALHWKWIVCILRGKPHAEFSGGRFALGLASLALIPLLAAAPLLTPAQTTPRGQAMNDSSGDGTPARTVEAKAEASDAESTRGFMTFSEVAEQSGLPVSTILERLGLPLDTSPSEQTGRILRTRGLDMSDLRKALRKDDGTE